MTFPAVLSALRELILDRSQLPASYEERIEEYRRAFPALNADELEDLAKINPKGFKIYATSTFVGQRTLIRRYLEVSSALIEEFFTKKDESFRFLNLISDMHHARPWRSTSCDDLLRNFISYTTEDLVELAAGVPGLKQTLEFEFLEYLAVDTHLELEATEAIAITELADLDISVLLQAKFAVPTNAFVAEFDFRVAEYCRLFYASDKMLPSEGPKKERNWCAVGCGLDFRPTSISIDSWLFKYLANLSKDTWHSFSDLAEIFIENATPGQSEEQIFTDFMLKMVEAIKAGILVLRKP